MRRRGCTHLDPSVGISRPVGDAIINTIFPEGDEGRIPIAAVTGINGKANTRFIAHILKGQGLRVGMTSTDGTFIDGRRIDSGDCSGPKNAGAVLMNPAVDAAVLETARGGVLREGLAFDRCDAAVVTNIGDGDHLGIGEVNTPEDLAKVKRCIVHVVPPNGVAVLNAADPLVVGMEPHSPAASSISPSTATSRSCAAPRRRRQGNLRPPGQRRGRRRRTRGSRLVAGPRPLDAGRQDCLPGGKHPGRRGRGSFA